MKISHKIVEPGKTFIIAELSCNHRGSLDIALKTVEEIAKTGVDAIKVQTMLTETMTLKSSDANFTISGGTPWDGQTFWDLYSETPLPLEWHKPIKDLAEKCGLIFFSTPFGRGYGNIQDPTDFLDNLGVPCYKIASFEICDTQFIKHVASKGKPIIISTGIATFEDIHAAVGACHSVGNHDIILLKCTSAYPTPMEDVNLLAIQKLGEDFRTLVGISDHSTRNEVSIASIALGGCVIEKHVILSRDLGGPDVLFSLEPMEMKELVDSIRITEKLLGKKEYILTDAQVNSKRFGRSLFVCEDIKVGDIITTTNVRSLRPGHGLHPKYYEEILGKIVLRDLHKGEHISLQDVR